MIQQHNYLIIIEFIFFSIFRMVSNDLSKLREYFVVILVCLKRKNPVIYKYFREYVLKFFMIYGDLFNNSLRSCYQGHVFYMYMLLKHFKDQFDPSFEENEPLMACVLKSHLNMVKLLLTDARVDPCARENFIIHAAYAKRTKDIYKNLVNHPKARVYNFLGPSSKKKLKK
jgi:hypothetical protein